MLSFAIQDEPQITAGCQYPYSVLSLYGNRYSEVNTLFNDIQASVSNMKII